MPPPPRASLFRTLRQIRRFFSADGFALAPIWAQLLAIFAFSALLIVALSPALGSLSNSYRIFADPSSYADAEGTLQLVLGLLQVLLGLVLFSFVISVLSAALEQLIERIKGGTLAYRKRNHLLIVNHNAKLSLILHELNLRAAKLNQPCDIVILLSDREFVDTVTAQLDLAAWDFLQIYLRQGDVVNIDTYHNLSIQQAAGLVILAPENMADDFARDNQNLKILASLTNDEGFMKHLHERQLARQPIKCSIELTAETHSRDIALALTQSGQESLFAVTNPSGVIGSVLSRSMINIVYYKVYFELLSFHGHTVHFVSPDRFASSGLTAGVSFAELLLGFTGGTLVGYSRTDADGRFSVKLCPFDEPFSSQDWLLFIAQDVGTLHYAPAPRTVAAPSPSIRPPGKIHGGRPCLIGSAWPVENLEKFLDDEGKARLHAAHFTFEDVADYFAPAFIQSLHDGNYDPIVINLDDETAFRFTLQLISRCAPTDPFLQKIVTVLSDPVIEGLLNKNNRYRNTVLSPKLAAKYIAQLSFQKNLEKFFSELAHPAGVEFNLLHVGENLPATLLTDLPRMRAELAAHRLTYIGNVDAHKNVYFGPENLTHATHILVLSHGSEIDSSREVAGL